MLKKFFSGKMILVLGVVIAIAGYQFYTNYQEHKDDKVEKDDSNLPLNREDTTLINTLYDKLATLFFTVEKTTASDTVAYPHIDTATLAAGFEPKVITIEALRILFDSATIAHQSRLDETTYAKAMGLSKGDYRIQNINYSLGAGDFVDHLATNRFDRPFVHSAKKLFDDRYLLVLVGRDWKFPDYNESTGTFASGSYKGSLYLYDLLNGHKLGSMEVSAVNDASINSAPHKKGEMDRRLTENLHENIRKAVNRHALVLFGKPL